MVLGVFSPLRSNFCRSAKSVSAHLLFSFWDFVAIVSSFTFGLMDLGNKKEREKESTFVVVVVCSE